MLNSTILRIYRQHADADGSAEVPVPASEQQPPAEPEKAPEQKDAPPSTLGENWPPNLRSRETDWFVIPEPEPTKDADRPAM